MAEERVTHAVVEMLVNLADQAGVSLAELCAGLPVDANELRHRFASLEWSHLVEFLARLEARVGAERVLALCATVPDVSPTGRGLFRHFLSARLLMRFVCTVVGPSMYPMYESSWAEAQTADGAVEGHLRLRLRSGYVACPLLFRVHAPAMASVPCFIGHPALPVRAETSERGGDYWFTLKA